VDAVPRGLHREHEQPWGSTPGKVRGQGAHPNVLALVRWQKRSSAVAFRGDGGAPVDGGGLTRFLQHDRVERELRLDRIYKRWPVEGSSPKRGFGGSESDAGSDTPAAGVDKRSSRWCDATVGRVRVE
jgi:hypothetical protein